MRLHLCDGRRAYESGCDGILFTSRPRSEERGAMLLGALFGAAAVIAVLLVFCRKRSK